MYSFNHKYLWSVYYVLDTINTQRKTLKEKDSAKVVKCCEEVKEEV